MFLLVHMLHITGPLAIILSVALIALRLWFRSRRRRQS